MLVLTRKHGEEIMIGSDLRITVVALEGNRVRLGITAPQEINIRRAELDERTDFQSITLPDTRDNSPQLGLSVVGP